MSCCLVKPLKVQERIGFFIKGREVYAGTHTCRADDVTRESGAESAIRR
jgi:hypothetical protein